MDPDFPQNAFFLTIRHPGDAGSLKSDSMDCYDRVNL